MTIPPSIDPADPRLRLIPCRHCKADTGVACWEPGGIEGDSHDTRRIDHLRLDTETPSERALLWQPAR